MENNQNQTLDSQNSRVLATSNVTRRTAMGGSATVALSLLTGCTGIFGGNPGDITVFNKTDKKRTAIVSVSKQSSKKEVLSETTKIKPSKSTKFNDVFQSASKYSFSIETESGLSKTHEWKIPSTDHYLYAIIKQNSITFKQKSP